MPIPIAVNKGETKNAPIQSALAKLAFRSDLARITAFDRGIALARNLGWSRWFKHDSAGAWAKRLYFASRAMMDSILRPYDIGSTQWYVLHQLAHEGPTMQRDLVLLLQIERATLSGVATTLVRKGLVDQAPDREDQRQRMLRLTRVVALLQQEATASLLRLQILKLCDVLPLENESAGIKHPWP